MSQNIISHQLYLSATQLSARLGVSRTTVWRYLKNDPAFPRPVRFGTTTRRWCWADVEEWITARTQ